MRVPWLVGYLLVFSAYCVSALVKSGHLLGQRFQLGVVVSRRNFTVQQSFGFADVSAVEERADPLFNRQHAHCVSPGRYQSSVSQPLETGVARPELKMTLEVLGKLAISTFLLLDCSFFSRHKSELWDSIADSIWLSLLRDMSLRYLKRHACSRYMQK